jgi:hypothetical protein
MLHFKNSIKHSIVIGCGVQANMTAFCMWHLTVTPHSLNCTIDTVICLKGALTFVAKLSAPKELTVPANLTVLLDAYTPSTVHALGTFQWIRDVISNKLV